MDLNNVQIKMMRDIESGITKLPTTSAEYYEHVSSIFLAVDTNAIEKPFLDKCKNQIVRSYFAHTCGKSNEDVYLSQIKNQLKRRAYFTTFSVMCNQRNADAFKEAYRSLIEINRVAKSDGMFLKLSDEAKKLIEEN